MLDRAYAQVGHCTDQELLELITLCAAAKNEMSNHKGYSPSQWVLGKFPRRPGSQFDEQEYADMGVLSAKFDPDSVFARQQELRSLGRL